MADGRVVGIDPGFSGAIAVMNAQGTVLYLWDMPTSEEGKLRHPNGRALQEMFLTVGLATVNLVALELVHAMPKQGVSSSFRFGVNWGIVLGVLQALALPYELVTPQSWQKAMYASQPKGRTRADVKKTTRAFVDRRWPGQAANEGQADALCIAEWARRHMRGGDV
jgi:crossover junction endodeoxyribonuclease RuvC